MYLSHGLRTAVISLAMVAVLSGCGDDDKAVNSEAIEFYAEFVLSRQYASQGGTVIFSDTVAASIDSAYSPLTPAKPCSAVSVTCSNYTLQWHDGVQKHLYTDEPNTEGFFELDSIYVFRVDSGQAVPVFEKSIRFPSVQPILHYPRTYLPPIGADSVSIADGFTITWAGTGSENVELIICQDPESRYCPPDTLYHAITENDGALLVSADELVNVTPGDTYKMLLIVKNSESVISEGYDPRGIVAALAYTHSHFYAIE